MQLVTDEKLIEAERFFSMAAKVARNATCHRAKCGTVIIKDYQVIGQGYNGPALDNEGNRTCDNEYDLSIKPKYDKTCCIHAEWRAILDACKRNPSKLQGSTLYFMRVDDNGNFTDAGRPYCTTCSRLTHEAGIKEFILWNRDGVVIYDAAEYNKKSYEFFASDT